MDATLIEDRSFEGSFVEVWRWRDRRWLGGNSCSLRLHFVSDCGLVICELPVSRANDVEFFVLRNCETVRQVEFFCMLVRVLTWKLTEEDGEEDSRC